MQAYIENIRNTAIELDLELEEKQILSLFEYILLMKKWNKVYNLTAVNTLEQAIVIHINDCMAAYKAIQKHLIEERTYQVYDIGTGAGLPAIVWAIIDKRLQISCVDIVEKKVHFILHVKSILAISNITPYHVRVETLKSHDADIIVSRAFASLKDYVLGIQGLLKPQTLITAMKAKLSFEEIEELQNHTGYAVVKIEPIVVPNLEAERKIVYIQPTGEIKQ